MTWLSSHKHVYFPHWFIFSVGTGLFDWLFFGIVADDNLWNQYIAHIFAHTLSLNVSDLSDDNDGLLNEIRSLKLERTNDTYKIDALIEENRKLKDLLREQCESDSGFSSNSESRDGKPHSDTDSELSYDLGLATIPDLIEEEQTTVAYTSDFEKDWAANDVTMNETTL